MQCLRTGPDHKESFTKKLKEAYEKEVADIKEKRSSGWCHLALTLDAAIHTLMRNDYVGEDDIGYGAMA